MALPFDAKRVREYAVEFGPGGQRLCCEFRLQDGSVCFVNDSQIAPEIERFIPNLGSPTMPPSFIFYTCSDVKAADHPISFCTLTAKRT
jgi:hypothetical protein